MVRLFVIIGMSLTVVVLLILSLRQPEAKSPMGEKQSEPLMVFCAASNRKVFEAVAKEYLAETGVVVEGQFGPSQTLLSSIEVSGTGDLYLPADDSYLELAREKGLVDEVTPLARMQVVVAVREGNPLKIATLADLLRADVRLTQANPDLAAVGKLTRDALTPLGKWDELNQQTDGFVSTVTEAANSVKAGAADAAIVYDAVVQATPGLEVVRIAEFEQLFADIKVGVITKTRQREAAQRFVRYLSARDRGLKTYAEFGFIPVDGGPWEGVGSP
ncbi:molybdate ABC transporter substrate-binding protein [Planctomicrobium piriforme]|uniref:Molybdate transport system substrate-binding protein n=1 Tax=Planctomicrobium piriforme TaxID=1576369 RepID=A0A1I3C5W9_9PLAN|nr:molybdate ABC transporter substrate-binding protein [Planctomicrobium piriforme]SFH69813.1 molybdate transport system substrate-binding protein [Planctomicrobium piriforme]